MPYPENGQNKLPDTWDEVAIAVLVTVVSVVSILKLGIDSVPIVTGAVGGLVGYLGGKGVSNGQ